MVDYYVSDAVSNRLNLRHIGTNIFCLLSPGKHLVFSTDPESVKDEFAFDNPGFRQEERHAWQHDAPTLPLGGKQHVLRPEFTKTELSKDDSHIQVSVHKLFR